MILFWNQTISSEVLKDNNPRKHFPIINHIYPFYPYNVPGVGGGPSKKAELEYLLAHARVS